MEENKDLTALLARIEAASVKQANYARWQCLFSALAAIFFGLALVCVLGLMPRVEAIAAQADTVMADISQVTSQLAQADWNGVVSDLEQVSRQMAQANLGSIVEEVSSLVQSSQTGLEQTMEKLNAIDFDTLNQAITDLAEVVEPLARLMKRL